jgi:hypothetical protein
MGEVRMNEQEKEKLSGELKELAIKLLRERRNVFGEAAVRTGYLVTYPEYDPQAEYESRQNEFLKSEIMRMYKQKVLEFRGK